MKRVSSSAGSTTSSATGQVRKVNIQNKLFLDLTSMSKNMQALLNNYEMMVIAQVSSIREHTWDPSQGGNLGLKPGESYFKCQVEKVEHIVNFTC